MFNSLGKNGFVLIIVLLVVVLAIVCIVLFAKVIYSHLLNKTREKVEEDVTITVLEENKNIKNSIKEKINVEFNKTKQEARQYVDNILDRNIPNIIATSITGNKRFDGKESINVIGKKICNNYEDIIKEIRNKFLQNNEELMGNIENKIKNYIVDGDIKDDKSINNEIHDCLSESMELYSDEVERFLTKQNNFLKIQIGSNVEKQLKAMIFQGIDSQRKSDFINNLKNHINTITDESMKKNQNEISQIVSNIADEFNELEGKTEYNKVSEAIRKNIEELEGSCLNSIQKNADTSISIAQHLTNINVTNYKIIKSDGIKEKFKEALAGAESEIDIISPCINNHVMHKENVYISIKKALDKKVKVRIIYGNETNLDTDNDNMEKNSASIANNLVEDFSIYKDLFKIKKGDTGEKMLICDNNFAIIGNFNFLSYEGKYAEKKNLESETAALITDKRVIERLRKNSINFDN